MRDSDTQKRGAVELHSAQADLFAARYGQAQDAYQDCFAYSRHRLRQLLDRYLPPHGQGARLLDVGCGTGHHVAELRQRGFEVAGMDASDEMLEHARSVNPGADLRRGDAEALPFPDASFDVVTCIEVLRYLPDARQALREMARVLRPGGVCLATAAPVFNLNAYWLVNRVASLVPFGRLVRFQQSFTTSARLRRQCLQAGFLSPAVHGVYFGPVNWVERLLRPALPRFLRAWEPIDEAMADAPAFRETSNMFLVRAVRRGQAGPTHAG